MDAVTQNFDLFVSGYLKSLVICAWGLVGSLLWGTVLAMAYISPTAPLRAFAATYVTVFRNAPLPVVLFFLAFGIPELGINVDYYTFAVAGLILYSASYVCEVIRAGINSVPAGQAEAGRAIGLSFFPLLRLIILPQSYRAIVSPMGSIIMAIFKDSAIVGAFGVGGDLFSVSDTLTSAQGFANFPILTGVAVGYLMITLPTAGVIRLVESRVKVAR